MAILKKFLPLLALPALTGCYENFEPDISSEPVLCLNSLIVAGKPIEAEITHTWDYNKPSPEGKYEVNDATLTVYANGSKAEAGYLPREGDCIRLVADSPTYGTAEAEVIVPPAPDASDLKIEKVVNSIYHYSTENHPLCASLLFNLVVELKVEDYLPDSPDYYHIGFDVYGDNNETSDSDSYDEPETISFSYLNRGSLDYDSEPLFSEHIGAFEGVTGSDATGFTFFTDRQFAGKSYVLRLCFPQMYFNVSTTEWNPALYECGMTFTLSSISESYYGWAAYCWQTDGGLLGDLSDIGLGDPLSGYSNVSTGAGVVAAKTSCTFRVDFSEFLKQTIEQEQ